MVGPCGIGSDGKLESSDCVICLVVLRELGVTEGQRLLSDKCVFRPLHGLDSDDFVTSSSHQFTPSSHQLVN